MIDARRPLCIVHVEQILTEVPGSGGAKNALTTRHSGRSKIFDVDDGTQLRLGRQLLY